MPSVSPDLNEQVQLQPLIRAFFFVSATSQSLPCVRHGTELHPKALRNKITMLITSKETAEKVSFNDLFEVLVSILESVLAGVSPTALNTVLSNKVKSDSGKHHFGYCSCYLATVKDPYSSGTIQQV